LILQWVRATTADNLPLERLRRLRVPLPPMDEQRQIANVLDRAASLLSWRQASLTSLNTMVLTTFAEMFGDPGSNPKMWPVELVGSYVASFQGGKSFASDTGSDDDSRHRILRISAVTGMVFRPDESKPAPDTYKPPADHFVRPGDLLITRANTSDLVGAVAYVERTPSNLLLPDKIWRFVWRTPLRVEPLFVWALFQTKAIRNELARRSTGTSGSMKNISQTKLLRMPTILPDMRTQRAFVAHVNAIHQVGDRCRRSAELLDSLSAALEHEAFGGNDE
jgi:type I restriction enzyme, S subunit